MFVLYTYSSSRCFLRFILKDFNCEIDFSLNTRIFSVRLPLKLSSCLKVFLTCKLYFSCRKVFLFFDLHVYITPKDFNSASFLLGKNFDTWGQLVGREFDLAAILEDRENLEILSRRWEFTIHS